MTISPPECVAWSHCQRGIAADRGPRAGRRKWLSASSIRCPGASAQIGVDAQKSFDTALEIITRISISICRWPAARDCPVSAAPRFRLVFADHQADPQKGRAEAERLITQEKVCAIIGTYQSAVAVTISQICERYQIPFMSADNSSPSLHRRGLKFYFRAAPHGRDVLGRDVRFLRCDEEKGHQIDTLSLFHEDTIFGTDSGNAQLKLANERGYKVVADIKYRSNSPSLSAEVQQLKAGNADVLMPSSYTTDGILLIKTMANSATSRARLSRRTPVFRKRRCTTRSATSSKA